MQFRDRGFGIVAINKGDKPAVTSQYVGTAGLTFPVVLGGRHEQGKIIYRATGANIEGWKRALSELGFK